MVRKQSGKFIPEWCNGSITDSKPVGQGSNPCSGATENNLTFDTICDILQLKSEKKVVVKLRLVTGRNRKPIVVAGLWGCNRATTIIKEIIMETLTELKKFDAVLRMTRFSTKRKGNEKKRLSKKACRKKVRI